MCSGLQGKQVHTVPPSSYPGTTHYHTFLSKARPIQTALFWQDPLCMKWLPDLPLNAP